MGAAFRLTSGYSRIDRGWYTSPNSPFAKRLRYFEVWRILIDQAGYVGCKGMEPGVVQITLAQLVDATRLPKTTVIRAIRWLRKNDWIVVRSVKRGHTIYIPHHELTHDMDAYILNRLVRITGANVSKSGPNLIDPNCLIQKTNLKLVQSNRTDSCKSGPNSTPVLSINLEAKTPSGIKADQTSTFLRELNNKNINIIPSTQTAAQTQASVTKRGTACVTEIRHKEQDTDDEALDMVSDGKPSEFDYEIAKQWAEGMAEVDKEVAGDRPAPKRRLNIEAGAKVVRALREIDGLSERAIEAMTAFRFEDEFYRYQNMWLANLRKRAANGLRKSDNLLERARAAHRKKKQQEANEESFGQIYYGPGSIQ